jgi:rhomboid protease GluP
MNTLALGGLGRIAESVYGGRRFLALLLLSTLGGGAASWLAGVGLSVGISGGVFGLMGALVTYGLWHRAALPHALRELFGRRLAPWVLVNLALGLPLAGVVDNACHLGGLVTGAIIGPFLADHILDNRRPSVRGDWLVLGINVGLIAWVVVGEIAR